MMLKEATETLHYNYNTNRTEKKKDKMVRKSSSN